MKQDRMHTDSFLQLDLQLPMTPCCITCAALWMAAKIGACVVEKHCRSNAPLDNVGKIDPTYGYVLSNAHQASETVAERLPN